MNKSVGPPASSQAEVTFEMTIPGNCVDTSAKKVSADLEEDSKEYSPTALTYNVFDGGSKRSRHSNGASRRCTFGWEWGWRYEWNGCNTSPFELGHAHEKPKVPLEKEKQMSKLCEKKCEWSNHSSAHMKDRQCQPNGAARSPQVPSFRS